RQRGRGRARDPRPRGSIAAGGSTDCVRRWTGRGAGQRGTDDREAGAERRAAAPHAVRREASAGTGPRGRVTRADVLRAAGAETLAPAEATGAKGEAQ